VLEEFSSGSVAKRFVVGLGAGRSTVAGACFQRFAGQELVNVPFGSVARYFSALTGREYSTTAGDVEL